MASPVAPPPILPPSRQRSFAGPVVLIVLGLLFLMGTMGILRWGSLVHSFGRFWPVLLIIWGVIKLLEYQQAQRSGSRPPGIGAGGAFLVIFLVVSGLIATQATRVNWDAVKDNMDIDGGAVLNGQTLEEKGQEIFDEILAVASGKQTKSELLGYGDNEFVPWQIGATF